MNDKLKRMIFAMLDNGRTVGDVYSDLYTNPPFNNGDEKAAFDAWVKDRLSTEIDVGRPVIERNGAPRAYKIDGDPWRNDDRPNRMSKIEGIKILRNVFGFGLKEAKDVSEGKTFSATPMQIDQLRRMIDPQWWSFPIHAVVPAE